MKLFRKIVINTLLAVPLLLTSTIAFACFKHDPNCIANCLKLPKWEQFFCMMGSTRHHG